MRGKKQKATMVSSIQLNKVLCTVAAVMCTAVFIPRPTEAIGLSPPTVHIPSILRNSTQTKEVTIVRSISDSGAITVNVQKDGEYADHIQLSSDSFVIPEGVNSVRYTFDVTPGDAANGDYSSTISFLKQPEVPEGGDGTNEIVGAGFQIITGVTMGLDYTVSGDEIVDFSLFNLSIRDAEVSQPLYASHIVTNTGNVAWKPDTIEYTFSDVDDPNNVVVKQVDSTLITAVQPGREAESVTVELTAPLEAGDYELSADFIYNNEIVETLEARNFTVYPAGTLQQEGELISLSTNKATYNIGEKAKLDAVFSNTGQVPVKGVLITELYRDDELIDLIRGEEVLVDQGRQSTLSEVLTFDTKGTYTLSSYIEYGFKKTVTQTVQVSVGGGLFSSSINSVLLLFGISVLIIGGALMYRGRKNHSGVPSLK